LVRVHGWRIRFDQAERRGEVVGVVPDVESREAKFPGVEEVGRGGEAFTGEDGSKDFR
jgi:hypothetical protein